jgi:two-component system sensor histidine kinase/response regulator
MKLSSGEVLLEALRALNAGDFTSTILDENLFQSTTDREIAHEINELAARHRTILAEHQRVQNATESGVIDTRATPPEICTGDWLLYSSSLNKSLDATTVPLKQLVAAIDSIRMGNSEIKLPQEYKGEYQKAHESITELAQTVDYLTQVDNTRNKFWLNMSHEIRCHMNGIIGMTELVLDTVLTTTQRDYLKTTYISTLSLSAVLNDLLDYSKIKSGKLDIESIRFNLCETLDDTLKDAAYRAHESDVELVSNIDPSIPDQLIGDPIRLRQIISNLIGNAIKFTNVGEIVLKVTMKSHNVDSVVLSFSVSDTGIGISEDRLQDIFDAFSQSRKYGGAGLSLAISSSLVELMNGKLSATSKPGEGSEFYFDVQFKLDKEQRVPNVGHLTGKKVLVVANNLTCRVLVVLLRYWGMQVIFTLQGKEAIALIQEHDSIGHPFNCVLYDDNTPGLDGFQVAQTMRTLLLSQPRPTLILLSNTTHRAPTNIYANLTMSHVLNKPIGRADLLNCLNELFQPVIMSPSDTRGLNSKRSDIHILLVEDNVINQKVATRVIEVKFGFRVTIANDGLEAVQAAQRERFSLILMDITMPNMDGFEAVSAIREYETGLGIHTPIIALTANAVSGYREECLNGGMDEYISKPIKLASLKNVFEIFLPS